MIEELSDIYESNVGRRQRSVISTHSMFTEAPNTTIILFAALSAMQLFAQLRTGLMTL